MTGLFAKTLGFCAVLGIGYSGALLADDNKAVLGSWIDGASAEINEVMDYPRFAVRQGASGSAKFHVTINRAGDVISSVMVERPRSPVLRSAARKVVDDADIPPLPFAYRQKELTFALNLNYQLVGTPYEFNQLRREGKVTGQQLAANATDTPLLATITLLDDQ